MLDEKLLKEYTEAAAKVLDIDADKLTRETNMKEECTISSLVRFQLMGDMEDVFSVSVNYPQIAKCKTFGDVLDLIEANL